MDRETKDLTFEIRSLAPDGTFEGLASTYGEPPDIYGDIIEPGAFEKTVADHNGEVVVLWQHDTREPIGLGQLESTDKGLLIKGKLELGLETASKAYIALKARLVKGLSIGFKTIRKTTKDGIRYLQEVRLFEVSLVTFPANEQAVISGVKSERDGLSQAELRHFQNDIVAAIEDCSPQGELCRFQNDILAAIGDTR